MPVGRDYYCSLLQEKIPRRRDIIVCMYVRMSRVYIRHGGDLLSVKNPPWCEVVLLGPADTIKFVLLAVQAKSTNLDERA